MVKMISIEDMQRMLDDIAEEFPSEFFKELNGGIILLPEAKRHDKSVDNDLYVLGEYHRGSSMGRYISIYYGSFNRVYGHLPADRITEKLRRTVRHEFRHHIESLAGTDDLERIDRKYIADYESGQDYEDDDGDEFEDDNSEYDDEYDNEYDDDEFDAENDDGDDEDDEYDDDGAFDNDISADEEK